MPPHPSRLCPRPLEVSTSTTPASPVRRSVSVFALRALRLPRQLQPPDQRRRLPIAAAPAPVSSEEKAAEIAKFASLHTDLDAARAELEQKTTHLTEISARLDDTLSQLRASQSARDAFAAKAAELEANSQLTAEPDPLAERVQSSSASGSGVDRFRSSRRSCRPLPRIATRCSRSCSRPRRPPNQIPP